MFVTVLMLIHLYAMGQGHPMGMAYQQYLELDEACSAIEVTGKKTKAVDLEALLARLEPIHRAINQDFRAGKLQDYQAGQLYISTGRRLADALSRAGQYDPALMVLIRPKQLVKGSAMELQLLMAEAEIHEKRGDVGKAVETLMSLIFNPQMESLPQQWQRMYLARWVQLAKIHLNNGDFEQAAEIYRDYFTKKMVWDGMVTPSDQSHWATYIRLTRKYGLERGKPELLRFGSNLGSRIRVSHPLPADHAHQARVSQELEDEIIGSRFRQFQNGELPLASD